MSEGGMNAAASFLVACAGIVLLAADHGGFFPRTWPASALAFALAAALALLGAGELRTDHAALVLVGGLAALTGWTAASALWSTEPHTSLQEAVRTLVYVAAALALTVLVAGGGATAVLAGMVVGVTGTAAYSLGDRLVNGVHFADQQGALLQRPLGYANALGALCAMALVVVAAIALGASSRAVAAAGAAAAALLATALILTGSRASWLAAAIGSAVVIAARGGKPRWAAALAAGAGSALAALLVVTAFTIPGRLGPRGDYWHAAWHTVRGHSLLGTGAGTYHLTWAAFGDLARRGSVLDAHSLYLETLAELGILGLLLVTVALTAPVASALTAASPSTTVVAALGGATTFLVHAGLDWDWEMPAVTVAGIACIAATLEGGARPLPVTPRLRAGAVGLATSIVVASAVVLLVRAT